MANEISNITVGSTNYSIVDAGAVRSTEKGSANGLATLGADGKVPSNQLPSFVDDVIEGYLYNGKFYKESAHTTEIAGEGGKIYVDLATEKTYRYSGSAFVEISSGGSTVSFTRNLTSGTKIGTITINGTGTDLYCEKDTDSWRPLGTTADTACAGNDSRLSDARTANGGNSTTVNGHTVNSDVPANAVFTDTTYTAGSNVSISGTTISATVPTKVSQLTNDSGYITSSSIADAYEYTGASNTNLKVYLVGAMEQGNSEPTLSNSSVYMEDGTLSAGDIIATELNIDSIQSSSGYGVTFNDNVKFTNTPTVKVNDTYIGVALSSVATTSTNGLMSASDKTKLNGIETGATKVTSDTVSGWGFKTTDTHGSLSGSYNSSTKTLTLSVS